jgi:murein DD-endopeptidase MepM/ murein hydrolase activator NlpD
LTERRAIAPVDDQVVVPPLTRRQFVTGTAAVLSAACVRAGGIATPADERIPLRPRLAPLAGAARRPAPPLLAIGSSTYATFAGHVNRPAAGGVTAGGVDYAPLPGDAPTEVCAVARGVVIASSPHSGYCGVLLNVGHGLGWKSGYCHLRSRLATYRGWVGRGEPIALMGATGTGASRVEIGGPVVHLHLTLWGPAWTPLYDGIDVQQFSNPDAGFAYRLDPEQFSVAGIGTLLPYVRPGDDGLDDKFLTLHDEAVRRCDALLARLGDAEALQIRTRNQWEVETKFDYHVDQRIWYLWQRLGRGAHSLSPAEAAENRAALRAYMEVVPRFTAPLVERRR